MKFELGQVCATPAALEALQVNELNPVDLLARHHNGDWGDLDDDDKRENDYSVQHGLRIFSAYNLKDGQRIWIITEWDRSVTTVMIPSDY